MPRERLRHVRYGYTCDVLCYAARVKRHLRPSIASIREPPDSDPIDGTEPNLPMSGHRNVSPERTYAEVEYARLSTLLSRFAVLALLRVFWPRTGRPSACLF